MVTGATWISVALPLSRSLLTQGPPSPAGGRVSGWCYSAATFCGSLAMFSAPAAMAFTMLW
ncbi:hypothetical protein MPEAHAMD_2421 [Methylobacterium frigidaeris]|uniref:Uncharacterized protein n=1 Tax=Methylobacterium frigidaeris TaxID=2038277 RepID=A0AA37HA73_9HYPH|nr:hypothetical protein MPEAHAMD_2421 [Methylobacterium frigidaeris]